MVTSDEEIILNHLDRYFTPSIRPNRDNVFDSLTGAKFMNNGEFITSINLAMEISSIYGIKVTSTNKTVSEIVIDWFNTNLDNSFNDVLDSLNMVKVIFGRRSWEVLMKKDNTRFNINWLIDKHKGERDKDTVIAVYEDWKHKQIIEISDKILNS
tara:strand:+ start:6700 stop:7164 length:465 start_codon:yes stop_codon:yes gene_type:complete